MPLAIHRMQCVAVLHQSSFAAATALRCFNMAYTAAMPLPGERLRAAEDVSVTSMMPPTASLGSTLTPPFLARYLSTTAAESRPSRMAQTTRDCPRLQSPTANTPGTLVANSPNCALKLVRSSRSSFMASARVASGPTKPMASRTRSASSTRAEPGTSTGLKAPVLGSFSILTLTISMPFTWPFSSPMKRLVMTLYSRGSAPYLCCASAWP
mmetsp:Transcript_30094/g.66686  ORF Transcript_30094/g.66686 Transcript_30094/m.66686 type:complete len:211 (+) Transcript_30094:703-1335(+)